MWGPFRTCGMKAKPTNNRMDNLPLSRLSGTHPQHLDQHADLPLHRASFRIDDTVHKALPIGNEPAQHEKRSYPLLKRGLSLPYRRLELDHFGGGHCPLSLMPCSHHLGFLCRGPSTMTPGGRSPRFSAAATSSSLSNAPRHSRHVTFCIIRSSAGRRT